MEYFSEGIHALVCACEDLQNSNLIFVDRNIPAVLKCLAYYKEFRDVLTHCCQNFDYPAQMRKACGKIGESNVFRLPKNAKTIVALVSKMLIDFDAGVMDIVSFASTYFPKPTKQQSWDECYMRVFEPFKLALVDLVVQGCEEEKKEVSRTIDFASNGLKQQTEYLLVAMANAVQESNLDEKVRGEFSILLEGFASALDSRDSLMIKAVWLGLRYALNTYKLCKREIAKVDDVLKLYLITK